MSREIKFRAWDIEEKCFIPANEVRKVLLWMLTNDKTEISVRVMGARTIKLMQFTGLLDKNGKEIYEGDIIMHGSRPFAKRPYIKQVAWNPSGRWNIMQSSKDFKHIIVGNVYENPELVPPN